MLTIKTSFFIEFRSYLAQFMSKPIHASAQGSTTTLRAQKDSVEGLKPWFYKRKRSKFGVRRNVKYNHHHWDEDENARYLAFLKRYIDLFKGNVAQKRRYHLNRMVSKSVGTRSAVQCRSHHQRLMLAHKTPENILKHFSCLLSDAEERLLDSTLQAKIQEKMGSELHQVDSQQIITLSIDELLKGQGFQMIGVGTEDYPWQENDSLLLNGDFFKDN